jgi:hypothetical protein
VTPTRRRSARSQSGRKFTGSLRHIESGKVIAAQSADFFVYDPESGKFSTVVAFDDQAEIRRQLQ